MRLILRPGALQRNAIPEWNCKVALFSRVICVNFWPVQMSPAPEQTTRRKSLDFLRWLPVVAAVALMVMVAFISARTMSELKNAIYWRQHSFPGNSGRACV